MSLFSWIWDSITAWVREFVASASATLRSWVNGLISGANAFAQNLVNGVRSALENAQKILGDAISGLRASWENFWSKTWPDWLKGIRYLQGILGDKIAWLRGAWDSFTTSTLPDIWRQIGNVRIDLSAKISRGIDDVKSWAAVQIEGAKRYVDQQFATLIPAGFIKDPLGYLGAAFDGFIEYWINEAARSFQEGFDEGLKAEEG